MQCILPRWCEFWMYEGFLTTSDLTLAMDGLISWKYILVNGIIVPFRAPKSAKIYKDLWKFGNGVSPLKTHTESVKEKLQNRFKDSKIDVHYAMRYQNPSMYDVMETMRKEHYDHIIVLPLFPQYASASNGSAIELAMKLMSKWWATPQVSIINQFWDNIYSYIGSCIWH